MLVSGYSLSPSRLLGLFQWFIVEGVRDVTQSGPVKRKRSVDISTLLVIAVILNCQSISVVTLDLSLLASTVKEQNGSDGIVNTHSYLFILVCRPRVSESWPAASIAASIDFGGRKSEKDL